MKKQEYLFKLSWYELDEELRELKISEYLDCKNEKVGGVYELIDRIQAEREIKSFFPFRFGGRK